MSWRRYFRTLILTWLLAVLVAGAVILVGNPFGNLPSLFRQHAILDTNQRYQYPAVARSGMFDSIVVGTSTSRLLSPEDLERVFGGRFANLAMDSGTPWEQHRMALLFASKARRPGTLIVGLDHVWCDPNADNTLITSRGLPEWMFNDPWIDDLPYMFNTRTLEISVRRIGYELGLRGVRIPFNGYEVFVPPEDQYDVAKVRQKLYGPSGERPTLSLEGPAGRRSEKTWNFPALSWLKDITEPSLGWQRIVFIITPVHIIAQPRAGSEAYDQELDCKRQIADLAAGRGIPVIDFRIPSPMTLADENYWDPLHYRVGIAARIVDGMAGALSGRQSSPDWKLLGAGSVTSGGRS